MRVSDGALLCSPSDVVEASTCAHRAVSAYQRAHGVEVVGASAVSEAVAVRGGEHEAAVVQAFCDAGLAVTDLSGVTTDTTAWGLLAERTLKVLAGGDADVVLQAGVLDERHPGMVLVGRPDFLVRLPDGTWRVEDAKLARSVQPSAVLQTMLYRDALAAAGVPVAEDVRLHLGDGRVLDVPARSADAWARRQLADFAALLAGLPARHVLHPSFRARVEWCGVCDDDSPCGQQRQRQDHLGFVAGMRRDQARKLAAAGITTTAALAQAEQAPPGLAGASFAQLREQAQLQVQARESGRIPVQVRRHPGAVRARDVRPGLWLLPEPDAGDVFFDMEGDPHYVETPVGGPAGASASARTAGLEYLFGATHDGDAFTPFWAHDRAGEGAAFAAFVDWVEARRAVHPGLHVYHYAPYERSALTRLAGSHATRGDVVDAWLREGVLVDLYAAVRGGLLAGIPSYSIKKVEKLYDVVRTEAVATAGDSIEQYEAYLRGGDPQVLAEIERYNRVDCDSTRDLRDYLLRLRADAVASGDLEPLVVEDVEDALLDEDAEPTPRAALREALAEAAAALVGGFDPGTPQEDRADEARRLLAGQLGYHVREEKAVWQDVFRVAGEVSVEGPGAAIADGTVLGGLELRGASGGEGKQTWTWSAPLQDTKVEKGQVFACIGGMPVGASVLDVGPDPSDADRLVVTTSMPAKVTEAGGWSPSSPPPVDALLPAGMVTAEPLQRSLLDLATTVGPAGPALADATGPRAAGRALLLGRPSLRSSALGPARPGEDAVAHAVRLVLGASGDVVAVQGPPGAGKSYLGTQVVAALLERARASGRPVRIGVTANSHAVVRHLLEAIHARSPDAVVRHYDSKTSRAKNAEKWVRLCEHGPCEEPALVTGNKPGWGEGEVLGGTAWAFSPEDSPQLDLLVVDEAGQMSLGDVLAASRNATNVLLLGDPQQLAKPSRATHPAGVAVSALEHLMRGQATMPPDVGIFLGSTRRMHGDVAGFISDISYDGRLSPHESTAEQEVLARPGGDALLTGTGLRFLPVEHTGNTQGSDEEAAVVVAAVAELLRRQWRRGAVVADVTASDVLVVSPYNVQVRRLRDALDAVGLGEVAVGTVDRFQGQEGVAVVYSTASSDADAAPRGLDFLYDTHRLNVAVSRARCLAVWVGSPELLRPRITAAAQVPLVDAHCRFVELALV